MKKNKIAVKAQEKRIKSLTEQERQEGVLLKNRRTINDLEYEVDKKQKEREKILRSPINEHSSEIKMELSGEDFNKKYPHLCPICGGENPQNITDDAGNITCNLCNCTIATMATDYQPEKPKKKDSSKYEWSCPLDGTEEDEKEVVRITPDNVDKYPMTISGHYHMIDNPCTAAFNDIKAAEYKEDPMYKWLQESVEHSLY